MCRPVTVVADQAVGGSRSRSRGGTDEAILMSRIAIVGAGPARTPSLAAQRPGRAAGGQTLDAQRSTGCRFVTLNRRYLEPLGGACEPLDVEQVGVGDVVGGGVAAKVPQPRVNDGTRPLP